MLGVDFGLVEFVFFAIVKAPSIDLVYAVNYVLYLVLPDGNLSIIIRQNGDIFVNCEIGLNAISC